AEVNPLPRERQLYGEGQGREGYFKFVHIPPGQYLILVNPDDEQNPEFPYRRTFYPSIHERESAAIVTMFGGEHIAGVDIQVEEAYTRGHLKVRVNGEDGRMIRTLVLVKAKPTDNTSAMIQEALPDRKTSLTDLVILANEPYDIEARLVCRYSDERSSGPGAT